MKLRYTLLTSILLTILIICCLLSFLNPNNSTNFQFFPGQKDSHFLNSANRVVVILPHPDDESIGMGGIIQKLKSEGKEVHCVLLTSGNGITGKNGVTDEVPLCVNYYGLNIPSNATFSERKDIIREDSFKRVMNLYGCSYEMLRIDDGKTTPEIVYQVMENESKDGYGQFYTTTGEGNVDHANCQNATKMMLEKYPQFKYRQFPVYWHAPQKFNPKPINADNYTDYDVSAFLPLKREAFEIYYNIEIFERGAYNLDVERIYYLN